jgi:DNA-binding winged helix-turn-helix (wHTH) protein
MLSDLEFVLGLLAQADPAFAGFEDVTGPHAHVLRLWQHQGFLAMEPELQRVPSCPHCREGTPTDVGNRLLCGRCLSSIDRRHLLHWRFDLAAFLTWLARSLRLHGDIRQHDECLWQLGSFTDRGTVTECFFCRGRPSEHATARLLAYRNAIVLTALPTTETVAGFRGPTFSLLDVLGQTHGRCIVADLPQLLFGNGAVRFDAESGALWIGDTWLGEVPVGSKEYHLLACLAENLDHFVPYADLKHEVLRRSGSHDGTDEATFCHKLKRRIKEKSVPDIDRLIATTNKADGYRLRGQMRL